MYLLTRTPDPIIRKTQQRFKKDKLHKKQPLYLSLSLRGQTFYAPRTSFVGLHSICYCCLFLGDKILVFKYVSPNKNPRSHTQKNTAKIQKKRNFLGNKIHLIHKTASSTGTPKSRIQQQNPRSQLQLKAIKQQKRQNPRSQNSINNIKNLKR